MKKPPSSDSAPLLSIIVPAYNSQSTLERCIDSVFSFGAAESVEVIIVDDCSSDQTHAVCTQQSSKYDGVRTHRNSKNLGVAESRNKGINLARGKYVGFLDSDDYYQSDQIVPNSLALLREHANDLIFIPTQNMARNDGFYSQLFDANSSDLSSRSIIQRINETEADFDECNGCFVSREFLLKNNIFFPRMRVGEDKVFMCSLILNAGNFSYLDQIKYVHTATAGGLATTFDPINITAYSEGLDIVKGLHQSQRDEDERVFLDHVLIKLFQSLCFHLLIFYQGRGGAYDNESPSSLNWIVGTIFPYFTSTRVPSPISYEVLLENLVDEIFQRIPKNLQNNHGVNYLYCLSEYSAAALGALTYKGIEVEAIIDDNRAGVAGYKHAGTPVLSLENIGCAEDKPIPTETENRFFVCHPSQGVFSHIKGRLLEKGFSEQNIVWIRFFE